MIPRTLFAPEHETFRDSVRRFVAPQRGPAQVTQLNKVLYDVKPEYTEPDFAEAFSHLALRVSRRSLVIVLTGLVLFPIVLFLCAACIFLITRPRWILMVISLVPSSAATCLLSIPETTRAMTSRSRGVSRA